jgi:general secretion pathway protein D
MQSGCFQGHQRKWDFFAGFFCIIGVFLAVKCICVAQESDKRPVLRNRVYKFRHISAKDAKERLVSLGIGRNINELPHNSIIVESDNPGDLVKASSLLRLIDSEQPFVIKTILTSPDVQKLPRNDEIAAELGDIIIGTFKEPPADTTKPSAIVDIHDLDLIAIAPEPLFDSIADTVLKMLTPATQDVSPEAKGPDKLAEPNIVPVPAPQVAAEPVADSVKAEDVAEAEEEFSGLELLEIITEIEGKTDAEAEQAKEDIFGDELLDALADAEKAVREKLDAQIREIEKVESVQEPPKVVSLEEADDSRPERPEAETIGITKEDLTAIVQVEVAKLLKAQAAAEPVEPPAPAPPTVPSVQPIEKQEQPAEEEKTQEEQHAESAGPEGPAAPLDYLDQLAIPDAEGEIELTLTLPEKVEITALLEMVGKLLGLNYIYDEKQIKGDVMLKIHGGTVKVKDAYALLESVLTFRGFVMTRRGMLVTIVPQEQALDYDPTFRTSPRDIQPGDVIVTSIFRLKHVDTASAEALLKSMKLGTIINEIPETGTLIVTGYAYRMGRIEELLKMIDVPGKPRKFQFRQLQYTIAAEVLPKVQTLAEQLGTISVSISVTQTKAAPTTPAKPQTAAERRAAARQPAPARPATTKRAGAADKQAVYLDTDERTNRILMIGLAEDIDIVNQLIDTLDVETPDLRVIKEYEIQHVDAAEIISTLGELGVVAATTTRATSQRRPTTPTSKAPAGRTPARPSTTTSPGTEAPLEEEPQISILETTNSLLINALPAQHAMIALVIAHVDRELEEATLPYVIYPLENQDPQELADVLAKLIEKTARVKAAVASAPDAKVQIRPTATTSPSKLEEEVTIVADPKSYSIIVYASKKNQQWISSIIKALDEYRPQVLLDVTLVEISKNDQFDYDLDMVSKLAMGSGMDYLTNSLLSTFPPQRHLAEATMITTDAGKIGKGFYADRHIQVLFDVMDKKGYGRVLARPKLLVNDNEKGTINATETTYITRTTTTYRKVEDEERPIESTTFEPYDAGITLDITPHISKGNNLRLIIELKRSDFDRTSSDGTEPYDKSESNVTTTVTVPDRSTIILGGMEKINQSKSGSKIPLLGDIPLLGGLFKSIHNTDEQKRIYIFVKAHILRPGEEVEGVSDIEKISEKNRALFEGLESKFQKLEDWPGIKPEPMDPLKILEEDIELPQ